MYITNLKQLLLTIKIKSVVNTRLKKFKITYQNAILVVHRFQLFLSPSLMYVRSLESSY